MPVVSFLDLQKLLPSVMKHEPVFDHVTFKVGGFAQYFVSVASEQELLMAVQIARDVCMPFYLIAGGSNLVFGDGVVEGLVIKINYGSFFEEDSVIEASAGASLPALIDFSFARSLAGLESLAGIPGTLGGAIVGNAGAYGRSISEVVSSVRFFDGSEVRTFTKDECFFAYRNSIFKQRRDWIVLSASLIFKDGEKETLTRHAREIIAKRERNYLPGLLCPGSFFKNILEKDLSSESRQKIDSSRIIEGKVPAGYLLEMVGAKGMVHGGIRISQNHGNLFINTGTATYRDVIELAELLKSKVLERFGVALEEEIRYIT